MRRANASVLSAVLIAAVVVACGEMPSAPASPGFTEFTGQGGLITAGQCTTLGNLNNLAKAVFKGGSPNVNSVLGKLKSLEQDVKKGKLDKAIDRAHDIVDFTLKHHHAGRLPGTEAELAAFVNAVYCFAGIDVDIDEPSNSHLILPTDAAQVVFNIDGQAAVQLPANAVSEPTLLEFESLPPGQVPGAGPLDTKLDQYPGFISITKSSETNAPLLKPVVVGVCATGAIPAEVRERLRLGHGKATGFELAAPAPADFLDCENLEEEVAQVGMLTRIANFLSPKPLHAKASTMFFRGGGVGGTVTEFSPFAPVDPVLRSGGGVGGTVTEFIRGNAFSANLFESTMPVESCQPITAPAGSLVPKACQPFIRVTTRLGTPITHMPVTWRTNEGKAKVAWQFPDMCGDFATAIVAYTDHWGRSSICWKLLVEGPRAVEVTPEAGGDAPEGVTFEPAFLRFEAVATPAVYGVSSLLFAAPAGSGAGPGLIRVP